MFFFLSDHELGIDFFSCWYFLEKMYFVLWVVPHEVLQKDFRCFLYSFDDDAYFYEGNSEIFFKFRRYYLLFSSLPLITLVWWPWRQVSLRIYSISLFFMCSIYKRHKVFFIGPSFPLCLAGLWVCVRGGSMLSVV